MSGSHRRHTAAPALYNHQPDTATVVRVSNDGRPYYQEDPATNAALEARDFDYAMGDTSLDLEEQAPEDDGISVRVKAKRYKNSDLPFQTWVQHRDEYLDEMLRPRAEGRPRCTHFAAVAGSATLYTVARINPASGRSCFVKAVLWHTTRCFQCTGSRLSSDLREQEWQGTFFKRVSLNSLGLVVQLGHTLGSSCTTMRRGKYKFTLIDVSGIHNVAVQFCECDQRITHRQQLMRVCWWPATVVYPSTCATFSVIRLFQNMNCLGKISAFHFLRSLELLTNADGLTPPMDIDKGNRTGAVLSCTLCGSIG
ncbi:hypothetical protein B0H14DRAFT_2616469 [Mycena olivaceomarginata]|nr:hypothetical protein B0H14DRAFT_2616469 [Mycena olivaceomarginata]